MVAHFRKDIINHNIPARIMTRLSSLTTLTVLLSLWGVAGLALAGSAFAADSAPSPTSHQNVRDLAIQRAEAHIQRGLDLGTRRAICSAQMQFIKAIRQIAVALDLEQVGHTHQTALDEGLRILALVEAPRANDPDALALMQQQLLNAQKQLAFAGGHIPTASMALYSFGRSYTALAEESEEERGLAGPKAITLYQAALAVDGDNYLAANELAVLLVRYGQYQDAEQVLTRALARSQRPELWRNLAVVYERSGRVSAAKQAQQRHEELNAGRTTGVHASFAANIRWTEPVEFNRNTGNDDLDVPIAAKTQHPAKPEPVAKNFEKKESRYLPEWLTGKLSSSSGDVKR